jgi:hypothetical protein
MSLGWMAFIAALIAIEKLLPWKAIANRGIAVLLVALGLGVAFAPSSVPGLTLPDSPEAASAMKAMGMDGGSMDQGGQAGGSMKGDSMKGDSGAGGMNDSMKGGSGGGSMNDDSMKGGQMHGGSGESGPMNDDAMRGQ